MVKVYCGNSSYITPEHIDALPLWRKEKALRYRREQDRQNCAAAYFLLERAFAEHGLNLRDYEWGFGERGKPSVNAPLRFSISHSANTIVCAVSNNDVGVDVQKIEPYDEELARYVLNEADFETVNGAPDKARAFFRLWTMREAAAKYLGTGMGGMRDMSTPENCGVKTMNMPGCLVSVCYLKTEGEVVQIMNKEIKLSGRLDTIYAPKFQPELLAAVTEHKDVTLDFAELEYVSSAGLRVLALGEKQAKAEGGSMTLINVSDEIMEVFDMTGFVDILTIRA